MSAGSIETERKTWTDDFIGTREQLIEAGLARPGEFPGDPGRNKTVTSYRSDGTYKPHCRGSGIDDGGRRISLEGKSKFRVAVHLSREERMRRSEAAVCRESAAANAQSERNKAGQRFLAYSIAELGLPGVAAIVGALLRGSSSAHAHASMRMLRRREFPAGWHVIDGGRHA